MTKLEGVAVLMEVAASLRLFHGLEALQARISDEAPDLGVAAIAWAPTALAALVMARCGVFDLGGKTLQTALDPLPLMALSVAAPHHETLTRAGINTLGELRLLPRGHLSRRFDAALLNGLDQTYGLRPEAHQWEVLPETFSTRVELMAREEHSPALLMFARPLLMQMCGWLAARHAGASAFTLFWAHDAMRSKDAGLGGALTIRTAEPIRDLEHFARLLAEHLAKTTLLAPVGELRLEALEVEALKEETASLLPETVRAGESLYLVLERIAARIGPEHVLQPVAGDDHRPEWSTRWQPAAKRRARKPEPAQQLPHPTFLLDAPLKLAVRDHRPHYQGPLELLIGPDRVEGGWWDRVSGVGPIHNSTRNVARDYWVAVNESAGVLSIYQSRLDDGEIAWYLHGVFA